MFFLIAKSNIKKNFSTYRVFIISAAVMLSLYIALASFMSNPLILSKISEDNRVESMARVIFIFFIGILFFYMIYFNKFFIKKRSYETGVLAILGFSKLDIFKILLYENTVIISLSYLISIVVGNIFYLLLTIGINHYLMLGIKSPFVFSVQTIFHCLLLVISMILINACTNYLTIRKNSLINFVRYSKQQDQPLKSNKIMALFGCGMLLLVYTLCLNSILGTNSMWYQVGTSLIGVIVGCCALLGTALVIRYTVIAFVNSQLKKKSKVYTALGNVVFPRLKFRLSSRNKLLIVLSLLISFTVLLLGIMSLSLVFPLKAIERMVPSAIEYKLDGEDQSQKKINLRHIQKKYHASVEEILLLKLKADRKIPLDAQGSLDINHFDVISQSSYKKLLEAQNRKNDLADLVKGQGILLNYYPTAEARGKKFVLENSVPITITQVVTENVFSFANSVSTLIVNDQQYSKLISEYPKTKETLVTVNGAKLRDNKSLYKEFSQLNTELQSSYLKKHDIVYANSSTFIFVVFIAIVFVVCSGSILYFVNLTEQLDSRKDYLSLGKLGYSIKQLKSILFIEISILFGIPITFGLLNGIFATFAFRYLFFDQLLGANVLVMPIFLSFAIFIICYGIILLVTKRSCQKMIFKQLKI